MLTIDKIAYANRFLEVHPLIKFGIYCMLLVLAFLMPPIAQLIGFVLLMVLILYATGVTIKRYLKWLLVPLPFLVMSFLSICLTYNQKASTFLLALPIFHGYLGIYQESLPLAIHLFCRSFFCVACTYTFALTVPFKQMLAIMKYLHLSSVVIEITMLMYRFIFILLDEVMRIIHAQQIRFGYHGLKNSYQSLALLIRLILQNSMKRYQEMVVTLEVKGFNGDFPI